MKGLFKRVVYTAIARVFGRNGDWMESDKSKPTGKDGKHDAASEFITAQEYDPWEEVNALNIPVKNPVLELIEAVRAGKATIADARLVEGCFNEDGNMMPEKLREAAGVRPYRIRRVQGNKDFLAAWDACEAAVAALPDRKKKAEFHRRQAMEALKSSKLKEDYYDRNSIIDGITTRADRSQFTEYTPIMGGPFHKQLYMFDALRSLALAFEAKNHNPFGKRIIEIRTQYMVGRGFKLSGKDQAYIEQVEAVVADIKLHEKIRVWSIEFDTYGELFIDNIKWQSIDPSTIWQVVHEPDDVNAEVYLFQSYPTDYQMFTGYKVPGAPGSEKIQSSQYIVRQIPSSQYIHIKQNCVSNEVRGRSCLFAIHGYIKMAADYLFARVVRSKIQTCFIFDDMVDGSDADVQAHAQQYSGMPVPGSVFAHNKQITRSLVEPKASAATQDSTFEDVVSVIATDTGIPKEHLNVSSRGGSRATALVSSEPWTKVCEDGQLVRENLIHAILKIELPRRGIVYDKSKIEVIFPEVTKDTTSERVTNLQTGEEMGWIDKQTAATDYYAQMGMKNTNFEDQQNNIRTLRAKGLDQLGDPPPPQSRTSGPGGAAPGAGDEGDGIHGQDRLDAMSSAATGGL